MATAATAIEPFAGVFKHLNRTGPVKPPSHNIASGALDTVMKRALAKVDKEGYDKTQEILKEAMASSQAAVAKAQADAKAETEKAAAEIASEKRQSLAQLRAEVTRLTLQVAEKVMETSVDPHTAGAAVQKFIQERS